MLHPPRHRLPPLGGPRPPTVRVGRRWRSPGCWAHPEVVLPGTSKGARLEDNLAAVALRLSDAETDELTAAV
ncbi:hypothetical protein ACFYMX_25200 [Streptomyces griseofuscus]|uniref:hypothetical protein n=1 Tax=Streptomyces TaxID=1883 RepID=UPI001EF02707|nr:MULTISPECIES: hypothetical protein [unclassified Streptomyces]